MKYSLQFHQLTNCNVTETFADLFTAYDKIVIIFHPYLISILMVFYTSHKKTETHMLHTLLQVYYFF